MAIATSPNRRGVVVARAGVVAVGIGLGYLVGRDGTPVWQAVRVLVVVTAAAAAWRGVAAPRWRVRVGTALVLSLVAVPVGGGIAGPHLGKTGLTASALGGLLALAGGLVLFGVGLAGIVREGSRRLRIVACAAAVLVLLVSCWTLGQATAATNVPRTAVGSRTPADLGLTYRDVRFPATDGVRLSGWYVPSRNGAAVVLLHGAGSTRSAVLDHAGVLARHGFGVLLFDARGHGRSAGGAMDFGWYGNRDIGGAVAYLRRQDDVRGGRIGAVGLSMGGEEAIGAAASVTAIRAVVAEGATARVAGDWAWLSDVYGIRGRASEALQAITYGAADLLTSARPPTALRDAARLAGRPTLLIAAGDVVDEAHAARYVRSGSPDTVELWVVPRTGHTRGLRTHPDEWERRVATFLDGALGVRSPPSR